MESSASAADLSSESLQKIDKVPYTARFDTQLGSVTLCVRATELGFHDTTNAAPPPPTPPTTTTLLQIIKELKEFSDILQGNKLPDGLSEGLAPLHKAAESSSGNSALRRRTPDLQQQVCARVLTTTCCYPRRCFRLPGAPRTRTHKHTLSHSHSHSLLPSGHDMPSRWHTGWHYPHLRVCTGRLRCLPSTGKKHTPMRTKACGSGHPSWRGRTCLVNARVLIRLWIPGVVPAEP